jgi:flagellar hook protein FlgE
MSFYTSLSGLKNAQTELNTVAHNLANAETNGFKKSRVDFADIVASSTFSNPKLSQGIGSTVETISQNFSIGPVEQTGSSLDAAITGDGFFTTKSLSGETMFTRNGAFDIDQTGNIHDGSGNKLQVFANGADPAAGVTVDAKIAPKNGDASFTSLTINEKGLVTATYADGTTLPVGTVALASFTSPSGLKQVGSSNWKATGLSGAPAYGTPGKGSFGSLLSGALERSNVDIAEELVNLITAQRYFQANAKAIDTATQISQTVMNLRT